MRIACLNGWGGTLHEPLLAYLGATRPDVLCLQEVVHTPASKKTWLTYRDGAHVLPQRANLFDEVARALPDHAAIFCPAAQGTLWDEETAVPSQFGLATFVRRDIPIVGQIQTFVHGAFSPDGFGAHPRPRNAHAVRLFDMEKGAPLSILHMHGLRETSGKADTPPRIAQAERLAEVARGIAGPGERLVVCGDFNVEPESATFGILGALGLTDLVTARGFSGTRTSHYVKPGRFADYMLVNDAVEVVAFEVVREPEVSDHCPLVLTV